MPSKHMKSGSNSAPEMVESQQPVEMLPATASRIGGGEPSFEPKKKRSTSQILSTVLIVVGVALLLVAGGMWGFAQFQYWKQGETNSKLQNVAIVNDPTAEPKPYPDIDWEALKAINPDVCGWIFVPDTVISYPVYQGVDNDQYLRTNAMGEYSVGGQVFLDYESTKPGLVDPQSIIYGHHMQDGSMFQPLALLDDQEVFDKTDTIWYLTESNVYELEPLMMYWTEPTDTNVRQFRFDSLEAFRKYLHELLEKAVTKRSDAYTIITGAKHVLTMSTCNYYDGYGRSILVTIPKDEATKALDGTTMAEEAAEAEAKKQQEAAQQQNPEEGSEQSEENTEGQEEWSEEGEQSWE